MEGTVLAGRYELIEKIAEGGMARVYRGRDLLLKRIVAVKILKDQMTGDAAFVRRFEREAQAAAALSHPHIVNIYDVGEEKGVRYIIMEYVDGENLKEYIRRKGRLQAPEAVRIARQIAEALEEAHRAGVVHRDIKPQNILFSREGKVKVTDFGIAIAGDGATVTVGDEIIGSVQYISPEQARGELAGKQSDLYSLGIVLYEMATGRVPFSGESPVAVAMKHIQEQIVPPRRHVESIPEALEMVIVKAVQKDIADRYPSAAEMLEDLIFAGETDGKGYPGGSARTFTPTESTGVLEDEEEEDVILKPSRPGDPEPDHRPRRGRWWLALLKLFLVLAFFAGLALGGWYIFDTYIAGYFMIPEVTVPDVRGLNHNQAARELIDAGLTPSTDVQYIHDETIDVGSVVRTDPAGGRVVLTNREVLLYLSRGPEFITTPGVVGRTEGEARVILRERDLEMEVVTEHNEFVPQGEIFRQFPGIDFPASPGDVVRVYISLGRQPFPLADLVGYSEQGALDYLEENDLRYNRRYRFAIGASGHVIEQDPPPGTEMTPGQSVVNLVIGESR